MIGIVADRFDGSARLRERLNAFKLRQLRQRITVRYHLPSLSLARSVNMCSIGCMCLARKVLPTSALRRCGEYLSTARVFRAW